MSDDLRDTRGRVLQLIVPPAVAVATAVIVFLATPRADVPVVGGGTRPADSAIGQLVAASLAGLAALVLAWIVVRLVRRR